MQAITGLVLLIKAIVCGVIGVRLLRLPSEDRVSGERLLGAYFVISQVVGSSIIIAAYGAWAAMGQDASPGWMTAMHGVGQTLASIGVVLIVYFTQKTFRPTATWAHALAAAISLGTLATVLGRVFVEGYAISLEPGPLHWAAFGLRTTAFAWVAVEAFRYWSMVRKRLALGLAQPLIVDRFVLWGLWASSTIVSGLSEPIARLIFAAIAGDEAGQSIHEIGGPILTMTLLITAVFTSISTMALFLTFFPTAGYRRWVERRAARSTGPA